VSSPAQLSPSNGAYRLTHWVEIEAITTDLLSFASHAGRTTITTDDVLLISRRNEALEGLMKGFIESENAKVGNERGTSRTGKGKKPSKAKGRA
jgi:centromere protein S